MKTSISTITAAMIATMTIATACSGHKDADEAAAMHSPEVEVAHPVADSIVICMNYPAYLEAIATVDVVARVDGFITSKHFNDGDRVHKGQVLFTIENTGYRDAVSSAEADLESAKSASEYASRQYEAMNKALQSDAVSQMDVIQARDAMNRANADILSAQAALETARTNLGYCTVRALSDGLITAATVDVGDFVSGTASPALATIYDDSTLRAKFSIEDAEYRQIVGERNELDLSDIEISFDTPMPHKYYGRLTYLAPDIEVSTGTMTVMATVDNPYGELRSGMYATVKLPVAVEPHAILVNDASLSTDQLGRYLFTVNDSNKVVYTPVKVGALYNDSLRIVTSGVTPADRYVTRALLKVRDGMTIRPVEAPVAQAQSAATPTSSAPAPHASAPAK